MRLGGGILHIGGNFLDGRLAVAAGFVDVRFHGDEINDAAKILFLADGELEGNNGPAEDLGERIEGTLETGEFAIHPGENKGAGNIVFNAVIPDFFGGDLHADMGVDGNERGVGGDEGSLGFRDERAVAGQVDEIDFDFIGAHGGGPFGVGEAGLNGDFARDFLFVPIGDRRAFRNFTPPLGHASGVEQRRHQLRFAGAAVAYNAHVADVLGEIGFHADLQRAKVRSLGA